MSLSPNDIRNYEFPSQMRGYDKEEVDTFKEQVANALEAVKQESLKLSMELESTKSQLSGLKQFEDTIKNAAIDARRNADMTIANAKKEADLIMSKAKADAEKELVSRTKQVSTIEDQITKIGLTKKSYLSKVRGLIQSHLDMIDELGGDGPAQQQPSEDRIEVESSSEVESRTRETVATQPSEDRGIKTEVANDSEQPTDLSESAKTALDRAISDAVQDESPAELQAEAEPEPDPYNTPGIDPELAAALQSYKTASQSDEPAPQAQAPAVPAPPGQVVETTARAEDIPDGFISSDMSARATGRVQIPSEQEQHTEHNSIDPDAAEKEDKEPESLANELDQVVEAFEQEMDKAAKS